MREGLIQRGYTGRGVTEMRALINQYLDILLLLVLFTLAKVPSLAAPFWWDEAGAYIPRAVAVAEKGLWTAMPGTHAKGELAGHPPVLYVVHGALYQIFGRRTIPPHRIVQLGFALLSAYGSPTVSAASCGAMQWDSARRFSWERRRYSLPNP
jgi:hypothetical protein